MLQETYKKIALQALERTLGDHDEDGGRLVRLRDFHKVLRYMRGPRVDLDFYIMALEDGFIAERQGVMLYVFPPPKPKKSGKGKKEEAADTKEEGV